MSAAPGVKYGSRDDPVVRARASMSWGMDAAREQRSPLLACMHYLCIFICMRTTLNLSDELVKEAQRLSGLKGKTAVIHAGLEALIARESARRLAALGGSQPDLDPVRRRRPSS